MAIKEDQIESPGPTIHSQPTHLTILSSSQLKSSPFLPSLVSTINNAFRVANATKPELGLNNQGDRLTSNLEFLTNFAHPESFTLVIHAPDSPTVLATASARPYLGPNTSGIISRNTPWERILPVQEGCEEWELKLMCTAPEAQGLGLATYMMGVVEEELRRRRGGLGKKLRILLTTPRELTGEFYVRKGFEKDYETWRGEGYHFHIVHMSKDVGGA
ncbi:uncharacterized protein RCC_12276 [Ramularia collo-cygni]|uniref:N-acetyltransferase domain-containing protein n=1 Tax=Ramularia collo-cygni TaxID=112498 RepID=A0A2D3UM96_9PEZI|nr:uncharacterized protein RCC_12276 [Ramularia collo-cygni]CZT15001.1 uncharacterized protein RCC_12276 [Ramularia collo-cygni]